MNIFNFIKRIFHIGGPRIELITRDSIYYPSDLIRGEILITAPGYKQNIQSITIDLKEIWIEYLPGGGTKTSNRAERYRQHDSITLANGYAFEPGMQYRFPFELRLPNNGRVSSMESFWRLGVFISASGAVAFRADFNIDVQLSKMLQTIIRAIERDIQFIEIPRGRKYIPEIAATRFIFRPPDYLQSALRYLELDLSFTDDGAIKGNMLFRMNKDSSFYQFKSGNGEDCSHEFHFEPIPLGDSGDQLDIRKISQIISDKLAVTLGRKNQ